jgi:stage V sporulation protein G
VEITEVRVKLMEDPNERLQAFCSVTFDDCFVVRDLKIIDGTNGLFVAMPSRKLTARCPQCGCKNHSRSNYCNQCGLKMAGDRAVLDDNGRAKLYADIAHPINSQCRETIQRRIVEAYHEEVKKADHPDYRSTYDDFESEDRVAVAIDAPKPASNTQTATKEPIRKDPPHVAAEQPHIAAEQAHVAAEQAHIGQAERPQGPHSKPSRAMSDEAPAQAKPAGQPKPDGQPKPSDGFGQGIL